MTGLRFIDANPAMEAFRQGQAVAQQQQAQDLAIEGKMLQNTESLAAAPNRLRTIAANADTARANANVAMATQPYAIENARSGSRLNAVNADVGARTADARVRSANASAVAAEMQGFYKSLDLLNAGQTDAAMQVASQYGQQIPQEVIQNAEVRAAVTSAAKRSLELYPSRPRDQQQYIHSFIQEMADRRAAGQPANEPTAIYEVPGAPNAPEISTTAQTHKPAEIATAEWLVANKIAPNPQAAWEMVRQSRSNPAQMRTQIYNNALRSTFGDPKKAEAITTQAMQFLGQSTAAPIAAPAPPPGNGTQAAPYQATTQDHVEWFKTSAPAEAVISIDGQLYTK